MVPPFVLLRGACRPEGRPTYDHSPNAQALGAWGANSSREPPLEESGLNRGMEENQGRERNLGYMGSFPSEIPSQDSWPCP